METPTPGVCPPNAGGAARSITPAAALERIRTICGSPTIGAGEKYGAILDVLNSIRATPAGSRICEYPGCTSEENLEAMTQLAGGEWFCIPHALLAAARDLVALYRVEGEADWTTISEILGETLPRLVEQADAVLGGESA